MTSPDEKSQKAIKVTRFMGIASISLSMVTVILVLIAFFSQ